MTDNGSSIRLTIDGREVAVPPGTTVVDAANRLGIEIPIFCHHPRMEPVGMCRMCLVEVGTPAIDRGTGEVQRDEDGSPIMRFFPKLQTGCTTRVSEGMVVRSATDAVADARRSVLEFLLTSHPLDCPVCDKGGECPLQNLTMRYGPGTSRFQWGEKFHFPKPVPVGPLIALDRERCVLCARCVRFQDEIADDNVLGFENRGRGMEIVSFSDPPFASYFSGNTTDICPVGALTTKDFRFESRVWETVSRPGVCGHCAVGCNVNYDTRHGQVQRVMPRENDAVNEIWICDKGRFAHHYHGDGERLTEPLVRRGGVLEPATWDEALGEVARGLQAISARDGASAVGGIAGDGATNEDLYMFGRFVRGVVGSPHIDHRPGVVRDDLIEQLGVGTDTQLTEIGAETTVVVAGLDVEETAPVLFLNLFKGIQRGARVVTLGGRPQKLDGHAIGLRYRYGSRESAVATALVAEVMARSEDLPPDAAALRDDLDGHRVPALEAEHPVHGEALVAAAEAIVSADECIVILGHEAMQLGLADPLGAMLVATDRDRRAGSGLVAVGPHANSQGAADMGLLPGWLPGYRRVDDRTFRRQLAEGGWPSEPPAEEGMDAEAMLEGGVRGLYVMATDPAGDDPRWADALDALDFLVVQELYLTETARRADVVLPARSLPECDGTLTNMMRRVQRTYAAVDPVGEALPDWMILRDIAQRMGVPEAFGSASDVAAEIATTVSQYAGITFESLGPRAATAPEDVFLPFAPMTEARHVSYEGTSYPNAVGEGLVWPRNGRAGSAFQESGAAGSDPSEGNGPPEDPRAEVDASDGSPAGHDGSAVQDAAPAPLEAGMDPQRRASLLAWRPAGAGPRQDGAPRAEPVVDADGAGLADGADEDTVWLVVGTRLYDRGRLMRASDVLHPLVTAPTVYVSPFDAEPRGLADGARVRLSNDAGAVEARVVIRDGVTPGSIIAAESLDWAIPIRSLTRGRPYGPVVLAELEQHADQATTAVAGRREGTE